VQNLCQYPQRFSSNSSVTCVVCWW